MRETKYPDNNGDMGAALYDFLPANAYLISSEHPIYSWSQCKPAVSKKKKKRVFISRSKHFLFLMSLISVITTESYITSNSYSGLT